MRRTCKKCIIGVIVPVYFHMAFYEIATSYSVIHTVHTSQDRHLSAALGITRALRCPNPHIPGSATPSIFVLQTISSPSQFCAHGPTSKATKPRAFAIQRTSKLRTTRVFTIQCRHWPSKPHVVGFAIQRTSTPTKHRVLTIHRTEFTHRPSFVHG